jgi:hypothetical protein
VVVLTPVVLWIVGEPGCGKTTLPRRLIADVRSVKTLEHLRPKWTAFIGSDAGLAAAAVGTWRGDAFDGGDTVPISDIKPALAYWAEHFAGAPLSVFDGDKFANENATEFVRKALGLHYEEAEGRMVCIHLVGAEDAAAGRLARSALTGKTQDPTWVKGRRTKSARFAEKFPGLVLRVSRKDLAGIGTP